MRVHGVGRDEASSSSLCQEFLGGCALHPLWGKCDRNVCAIPHHIERVIGAARRVNCDSAGARTSR